MTEAPHSRVVIAGGGTAGWVAAAALVRTFGPLIDMTLVESDAIATIGVGESTIPTARLPRAARHQRRRLHAATQATFKLGIAFENWARVGDRYFHPFGTIGHRWSCSPSSSISGWRPRAGFGGAYIDYCLEWPGGRSRKFAAGDLAPLAYAYHLDAGAMPNSCARSPSRPACKRRRQDPHVERDGESGDIAALVLESGTRIEGDLFIDCTGFRALLIEETLETGFDDWGNGCPPNRAFAVQTENVGPPVPYTPRSRTARAGAGASRCSIAPATASSSRARISPPTRRGRGCSRARGQAALRSAADPVQDRRPAKMWNRNCVSLGLASGFIEPLESTSIHLVMIAVTRLLQDFPFRRDTQALAERFNAQSRAEWEHVRDFIILHYKLNQRDDTAFWREHAARAIPESLAERIALFSEAAIAYQGSDDLFRIDSWNAVMMGQGVMPRDHHRMPAMMPSADLERALGDLRAGIAAKLAGLPSHADFLASHCAAQEGAIA
jgi:tryptophan halogenase